MQRKYTWFGALLFLIAIVAAILRLYQLGNVPVSLYWDETAIGYNAYSIAQTGKDEYGEIFPILFRSFEDYKLPGYIYTTAVSVKLLGLSEFSVRLPSALFGIAAVILTYFLTNEILTYSKRLSDLQKRSIAILSSLLLAISPWHLQFSRAAFEANGGLFFALLGMFFFFKGVKSAGKGLLFAFLAWVVSFYFYRSIPIFIICYVPLLLTLFRKEVVAPQRRNILVVSVFLSILLLLPFGKSILSKEGLARTNQVSIVQAVADKTYTAAQKQLESGNTWWSKVIYNRRLLYSQIFITNYLSHFSPTFLFFDGDGNGRHGVQHMGLLYLWELPFLLLGILFCVKESGKTKKIFLFWAIAAPLAASFSMPSPHALRSLNFLPLFQIITAIGVVGASSLLLNKQRLVFCGVLIIVISYFLYTYLLKYYGENKVLTGNDWADGYKQTAMYVFSHEEAYDKVVISGHYWEPYIYFLFYKKYDSKTFQKYGSSKGFDKYVFGGTSWDKEKNSQELGDINIQQLAKGKKILTVLSPQEYESQKDNITPITEIKNHSNEIRFFIGAYK